MAFCPQAFDRLSPAWRQNRLGNKAARINAVAVLTVGLHTSVIPSNPHSRARCMVRSRNGTRSPPTLRRSDELCLPFWALEEIAVR